MNTKKLYLFNYAFGSINAISMQMIPLIFIDKSFDTAQITTLLSVIFLAALFQPIVGYIARNWLTDIKTMQLLLTVIGLGAIGIFATSGYVTMALVILLYSIARISLSPMYDSYVMKQCAKNGENYGLIRSGASLGYGTGMIVFTLIAVNFGLTNNAAMLYVLLVAAIGFAIMSRLPEEDESSKQAIDSTERTNLIMYILLVLIYMIYFGSVSLRISYLSTYYTEFGYSTAFISLTTFFMVIPEVLVMPLYNKLFGHLNKVALIGIAIAIGILQLILYVAFTANPIILLFVSLLNGFQIMLFFPSYFFLLQKSLSTKSSSFGFVMNMTIQSLFVGLFNLFVIKPIYIASNTTLSIMHVVALMLVTAFIPLLIYNFKYYRHLKFHKQAT